MHGYASVVPNGSIYPSIYPVAKHINIVFVEPIVAPDYDKEILIPLRVRQEEYRIIAEKKAEEVRLALIAAQEADKARLAQIAVEEANARQAAPQSVILVPYIGGELIGSYGYSNAFGNCVNEPGVNNPHDGTNPISWAVTSQVPWIGASVLFYFNHVAVVTGIWSNGDIEVRHQNSGGAPHRYPRSEIRGFR